MLTNLIPIILPSYSLNTPRRKQHRPKGDLAPFCEVVIFEIQLVWFTVDPLPIIYYVLFNNYLWNEHTFIILPHEQFPFTSETRLPQSISKTTNRVPSAIQKLQALRYSPDGTSANIYHAGWIWGLSTRWLWRTRSFKCIDSNENFKTHFFPTDWKGPW